MYHVPVLLPQAIEGLRIRPDGTYVDLTYGGGGHSRAMLAQLGEQGRLLAFDQDSDVEGHLPDDPRFTFVRSNFRYLHNFLRYHGVEQVDGILADLGVSSHHLDEGSRGFSFRQDAELDMRMNRRASLSATDVVNSYDEEQLADIFHLYGELKNSRQLAQAIVKARQYMRITRTGDLMAVLVPKLPRDREKKDLARAFQAIRIEVNQELEALKEMLRASVNAVRPGGRLVVITYHSLEDRMVKNLLKAGNVRGKAVKDFYGNLLLPFRQVNAKVITPSDEEVEANPRSRSAKLRIGERLGESGSEA